VSAQPVPPVPGPRLRTFRVAVVAVFVLLVARLWHIQFARGAELRRQAEANSFVPREIEADRGVLYDSAGRKLVVNSPRFSVAVVPAALASGDAERWRQLGRLADLLGVPLHTGTVSRARDDQVDGSRAASTFDPDHPSIDALLPRDETGAIVWSSWDPVPVARNVPRETAFAIMEAQVELPFVTVGESSVRQYPAGPTMGQILGFTGSVPEDDLATYLAEGYRIYDIVGRDGLEATYERYLRGVKGQKIVEIDASGREQRQIGQTRAPVPGYNLHLTIDLEFQRAVEEALARGMRRTGVRSGAAVALDPRDGAIRALVSLPNYDNNLFSLGARAADFAELVDNPDRPLVNRAIAGLYAPGSTFKLITASAALQEGIVTPATRIFDPGHIELTNEYDPTVATPFYCWLRSGHGSLNIVGAIAHSCNVFFYQVAGSYYEGGHRQEGLGSERLGAYARRYGLGQTTGIELLGEAAGRVPTKAWFTEWYGETWTTGVTYDMGIGQANLLVTPIQMARVVAAVANGGTLYRPHLVERVTGSGDVAVARPGGRGTPLGVDGRHLAVIREGMRGAVQWGTAQSAWTHLPIEASIAGKTGTAIFCDYVADTGGDPCRRDREGNLLTHGWFTAFAPYDAPEIVVVVILDGSGLDYLLEGSRHAAPVAADVFRAYFDLPTPAPSATACADCPAATPAATAVPPRD
jgi:penicillin-binding protein 2